MTGCDRFDLELTAYVDGALEEPTRAGLEAHLSDCPVCTDRVERERRVRAALRHDLAGLRAPPRLRAAIQSGLRAERRRQRRLTGPVPRWLALAAALVVAVFGGREWGRWEAGRWTGPALARAALAAHVRALGPGPLTEVLSSEHHTVKPWFAGRLDFSPPVPQLDSLGFGLKGGRVDRLEGHPAAALVYGRRRHVIDLFLWPTADSASHPPSLGTLRGFQYATGQAGGMAFVAITDLNRGEFAQFTAGVAAALGPP